MNMDEVDPLDSPARGQYPTIGAPIPMPMNLPLPGVVAARASLLSPGQETSPSNIFSPAPSFSSVRSSGILSMTPTSAVATPISSGVINHQASSGKPPSQPQQQTPKLAMASPTYGLMDNIMNDDDSDGSQSSGVPLSSMVPTPQPTKKSQGKGSAKKKALAKKANVSTPGGSKKAAVSTPGGTKKTPKGSLKRKSPGSGKSTPSTSKKAKLAPPPIMQKAGEEHVDEAEKFKRRKRMHQVYKTDLHRAYRPDHTTPFKSLRDIWQRLSCYHALNTPASLEKAGNEGAMDKKTNSVIRQTEAMDKRWNEVSQKLMGSCYGVEDELLCWLLMKKPEPGLNVEQEAEQRIAKAQPGVEEEVSNERSYLQTYIRSDPEDDMDDDGDERVGDEDEDDDDDDDDDEDDDDDDSEDEEEDEESGEEDNEGKDEVPEETSKENLEVGKVGREAEDEEVGHQAMDTEAHMIVSSKSPEPSTVDFDPSSQFDSDKQQETVLHAGETEKEDVPKSPNGRKHEGLALKDLLEDSGSQGNDGEGLVLDTPKESLDEVGEQITAEEDQIVLPNDDGSQPKVDSSQPHHSEGDVLEKEVSSPLSRSPLEDRSEHPADEVSTLDPELASATDLEPAEGEDLPEAELRGPLDISAEKGDTDNDCEDNESAPANLIPFDEDDEGSSAAPPVVEALRDDMESDSHVSLEDKNNDSELDESLSKSQRSPEHEMIRDELEMPRDSPEHEAMSDIAEMPLAETDQPVKEVSGDNESTTVDDTQALSVAEPDEIGPKDDPQADVSKTAESNAAEGADVVEDIERRDQEVDDESRGSSATDEQDTNNAYAADSPSSSLRDRESRESDCAGQTTKEQAPDELSEIPMEQVSSKGTSDDVDGDL